MRDHDARCMKAAIEHSRLAVEAGCMPFGAVLVDESGTILVEAQNAGAAAKKRGGAGDVTRHAEMELIRKATTQLTSDERKNCTLYTSTEPCVMCAGAIYWGGISRVVYGCSSLQLETQLSGPGGFDIDVRKLYGMGRSGTRKMEVEGPLLAEEALQVHAESGIWMKCEEFLKNKASRADQQDIEVERSLLKTGLASAPAVDDGAVPVIDLSSGSDEEIAQQLWDAATSVGFFTVIGHGIPQATIDSAFDASATFFSQSMDEKKAQSPFAAPLNSGYEFMSQVRPSTGLADQKESLQITARTGCMDGRWPAGGDFQPKTSALMEAAQEVAGRILNYLEPKAIPKMKEPGTLAKSHTLWADDGQCTLRLLHYPPVPKDDVVKLREAGYWRAGAHTDWDNVTLLFQKVRQGGLECCANPRVKTENQYWTAVNPVEGGIAVNIGDMLSRWSDGRLHSNLHRVRLPKDEELKPPTSRYSIAFFAQSDKKVLIESTTAEPITAGDYIYSRVKSNFEADFQKREA